MIKLTDKELKIITGILNKYVPDCEVRVFGSRFKGTAKEYSDLDLAIVGKEKLNSTVIEEMKEEFQESDLPFRVDLLDWNAISAEFRKVIEEKGFKTLSRGKH